LTGQTENHVPQTCLPQGNLSGALPLHTQKHCTARRVLLGVFHPSLTTKGSWMYFGGGSPSLSSALWIPLIHTEILISYWVPTTKDIQPKLLLCFRRSPLPEY